MQTFTPKQPGETLNIGFDFSASLAPTEVLNSATVTVSVLRGTDIHPENMMVGSPEILGGVVSHFITGGIAGVTYMLTCTAVTSDPQTLISEGVLEVRLNNQQSHLFLKAIDVAQIRANQTAISGTNFNFSAISDDDLWLCMIAAETDLSRRLGISLAPTKIFTDPPTEAELLELAGKPYLIEPGYDMPPNFLGVNKFGCFRLRETPVISIESIKMVYPNAGGAIFEIPSNWIRCDYKYGLVHIFPSSQLVMAPISMFTMQAIAAGMTIPDMIRVKYTAGLNMSSELYPDVIALAKRMSVLRIIQDAWMPNSESISADGLSQSQSYDLQKLQAGIDDQIEMLKARLLGPTYAVL